VDAVLQMEGDRYRFLRVLRAVKKLRPTNEIGIFEMNAAWWRWPSVRRVRPTARPARLVAVRDEEPVDPVSCRRWSPSDLAMPPRHHRTTLWLSMIVAALGRCCGTGSNIFENGRRVRIDEPAADLAVAMRSLAHRGWLGGRAGLLRRAALTGAVRAVGRGERPVRSRCWVHRGAGSGWYGVRGRRDRAHRGHAAACDRGGIRVSEMVSDPRQDPKLMDALRRVSPGTTMRQGINDILRGSEGALIVIGEPAELSFLFSGGIRLDQAFSPYLLYELAKMDGAIILNSNATRIVYANVQLMPDPTIRRPRPAPGTAPPSAWPSRPARSPSRSASSATSSPCTWATPATSWRRSRRCWPRPTRP
jgi:hypothetical protein